MGGALCLGSCPLPQWVRGCREGSLYLVLLTAAKDVFALTLLEDVQTKLLLDLFSGDAVQYSLVACALLSFSNVAFIQRFVGCLS